MTTAVVSPAENPVEIDGLRNRVDAALSRFLDEQESQFDTMVTDPASVSRWQEATSSLRDFLRGGKRLRPAFCYWGWRAAGGDPDDERIVTAAAALELLHAFALIHDDLIDESDTRRGAPSLHRRHEALHHRADRRGSSELFGSSVAMLLGDLCHGWFHEMLDGCGLPAERLQPARTMMHRTFTELVVGQYLDLDEQTTRAPSVERARTVIRYKTARYTIERPMQLGGVLAGATPDLLSAYTDYALPLGEAFQLRDDVLGAFGDPHLTGKPVADDLRTRKATLLIATARHNATVAQADQIDRMFSGPDLDDEQVEQLQAILVQTGAAAESEQLIRSDVGTATAISAAMPVDEEVRDVLDSLAVTATNRTH